MRLLTMSARQRERLGELGVLAINPAGQEVLHGLNQEESEFLLACTNKAPAARTAHERKRYAELLARHERARLKNVSVGDAALKNEASSG